MTTQHQKSRRPWRARRPRGWGGVALLALFLAVAGGGGVIGSTFAANFSGQNVYDTSAYSSASLTTPKTPTATPSGNKVVVKWKLTSHRGNKWLVARDDTGAAATPTKCTSSKTFTAATTTLDYAATTTTTTYTTTPITTYGAVAGDWICYRVESAWGKPTKANTSWTSATWAYVSAQVGLVANKLALERYTGTTPTHALTGTTTATDTDTIVITFNQAISAVPSSAHVCVVNATATAIILGDTTATTAATCAATNTSTFGKLSSTVAPSKKGYYGSSTYHLSSTKKKLTVILKGNATATKPKIASSATWTFVPKAAGATLSKATATPTVKLCATNTHAAALCQPKVASAKF